MFRRSLMPAYPPLYLRNTLSSQYFYVIDLNPFHGSFHVLFPLQMCEAAEITWSVWGSIRIHRTKKAPRNPLPNAFPRPSDHIPPPPKFSAGPSISIHMGSWTNDGVMCTRRVPSEIASAWSRFQAWPC
jgi:hypothetical protein